MTTPQIPPIEAYQQRPTIRPLDVASTGSHLTTAAHIALFRSLASTSTFYPDISKWQRVADSTMPYPVLAYRVDSGYAIDIHAALNAAVVANVAHIRLGIGYGVHIPGESAAILARVKRFYGPKPPANTAFMLDMESGAGFAGPGNHSTEANTLVNNLADYFGSTKKIAGYANHYDWDNCWPTRPAWLKRVTAAYSTTDPGTYGHQYYGGDPRWPSPAGYPRTCPPFGSVVDMNVIHKPISDVLIDFGVTTPGTSAPSQPAPPDLLGEIMAYYASKADFEAALRAIVRDEVANGPLHNFNKDNNGDPHGLDSWMRLYFGALEGYTLPDQSTLPNYDEKAK